MLIIDTTIQTKFILWSVRYKTDRLKRLNIFIYLFFYYKYVAQTESQISKFVHFINVRDNTMYLKKKKKN